MYNFQLLLAFQKGWQWWPSSQTPFSLFLIQLTFLLIVEFIFHLQSYSSGDFEKERSWNLLADFYRCRCMNVGSNGPRGQPWAPRTLRSWCSLRATLRSPRITCKSWMRRFAENISLCNFEIYLKTSEKLFFGNHLIALYIVSCRSGFEILKKQS